MFAMSVLILLVFSYFLPREHQQAISRLYLIDRFHLPVQAAQIHPVPSSRPARPRGPDRRSDRRQQISRNSDLGVDSRRRAVHAAAAVCEPVLMTGVLTVIIGVVLASAFSAILVYAQELIPARSAWWRASSSASLGPRRHQRGGTRRTRRRDEHYRYVQDLPRSCRCSACADGVPAGCGRQAREGVRACAAERMTKRRCGALLFCRGGPDEALPVVGREDAGRAAAFGNVEPNAPNGAHGGKKQASVKGHIVDEHPCRPSEKCPIC